MSFSFQHRQHVLQTLSSKQYDLIVIGGGITGAGIALDASLRGLKTLLVEKNDFASGTSSRSTKLIHGGLRYLKQLEFGLVKEVGSERAVVHKLAPHLVLAEKMLLPLSEGRGFGSFLTSFGLKLYDWLAGVKPEDQRKMLTRKQTLKAEPLLKPDDIKGGGLYAEYRTDDARLTIELLKTAHTHNADAINYCSVAGFSYDNAKLTGVKLQDGLSANSYEVSATVIINAAGPWVDELRTLDNSKRGKQLHLTKGVHIVVSYEKLPVRQAIYFDVADGRMIFAIPRARTTYIGTTDTEYTGSKEEVITAKEDAEYLLKAVNEMFPSVHLTLSDVESSWAGLRPLIHEEGKSANELSRKDEIFISSSGLISMAGGKLTGYRKMAERAVDLVVKRNFQERKLPACFTDSVSLSGGNFIDTKALKEYHRQVQDQLAPCGLGHYGVYLVNTYGRNTDLILKKFESVERTAENLVRCEVCYTIEHEMAVSAEDYFVRRSGQLFFDIQRMQQHSAMVLDEFKKYFAWTESTVEEEKAKLVRAIRQATRFKEFS